jgi:HK97 family phage major capsid protein
MSDIQTVLESFIKAQDEKLKAIEVKADAAIEKATGQSQYKAIDQEVKNEVRELTEQYKSLSASLNDLAQKHTIVPGAQKEMSAAEEFVKSDQYKQLVAGNIQRARIEVKNTVTSGSTTVFPDQKPGVITGNFAPLTVRQILRTVPTSSNMVNALREASWTNSAAFVAQGSTKPESDVTFEQYNVAIETVAHTIKMSNQLLADAPAVVAYMQTRLRDGLSQKIETQLIAGNGTPPQLSGLTDSGNYTAYTPTSDDLLVDAINRAKYTLWGVTGMMPDTVIVNPITWAGMERTREGAGTGAYLYGLPGVQAGMNPFGVRVVLSNNVAADKFIIGAMDASVVLYQRQGAVIEFGYVNDDFAKNLVTARAEERLGLAVERPSCVYFGSWTA